MKNIGLYDEYFIAALPAVMRAFPLAEFDRKGALPLWRKDVVSIAADIALEAMQKRDEVLSSWAPVT